MQCNANGAPTPRDDRSGVLWAGDCRSDLPAVASHVGRPGGPHTSTADRTAPIYGPAEQPVPPLLCNANADPRSLFFLFCSIASRSSAPASLREIRPRLASHLFSSLESNKASHPAPRPEIWAARSFSPDGRSIDTTELVLASMAHDLCDDLELVDDFHFHDHDHDGGFPSPATASGAASGLQLQVITPPQYHHHLCLHCSLFR